jgi:hypothetical protein
MPFSLKSGLILLSLTVSILASAEVRFEQSRVWKRARTLPASQQVWGFQSSYQNTSQKFGTGGKTQPLGQPYGRTVTWQQILDNESTAQGRSDLENYMRSRGAAATDVAATSSYEVSREDVGLSLDWAYGLMRRWMIGFDVPLTFRRTRVRTKVDVTSGGSGRGDMAQKVRRVSEQELASYGYDDVPEDRTSWDWGDISLMSQVAAIENFRWQWSLQQLVKFPTARNPELDSYIQSSDDSGQVDLGLTSMLDYKWRSWTIGAHGGYVAQLPDTVRTRVSSSSEARRVDPKVARDLGDYYWAAADGDYRITPKFNVNLEYQYLRKFSDKYSGASVDGVKYSTFGQNSEQELHQTRLGLQYRLRYEGARGGVDSKWLAMVGYTQPWIGSNSSNAGRASVDFISYF